MLDIRQFKPLANTKLNPDTLFNHVIMRGWFAGQSTIWFCKEVESPAIAAIEYLANEFFRVIIPHQPETRLARDRHTGVHFILSAEIQGYRPLPHFEYDNFSNGQYTGLGQVLAVAMFLQEIDLKNGNIGLDKYNRVQKIDGGMCFAGLFEQNKHNLSPVAIENLPFAMDFFAYNWLDDIRIKLRSLSTIVNFPLSASPQFRAEVNQALHRICLMPDSFIHDLVDACMYTGGQRFIDLIISRRNELQKSALTLDSFVAYLQSPEANLNKNTFYQHMASFKVGGLPVTAINPYGSSSPPILFDCHRLLKELRAHLSYSDHHLLRFILDKEALLANNPRYPGKIKSQLIKVRDAITSPEVMSVKATIDFFISQGAGFFNHRDRALRLQQALDSIPLEKRQYVISSPEVNPVQIELAGKSSALATATEESWSLTT